jgi:hypothetical protein
LAEVLQIHAVDLPENQLLRRILKPSLNHCHVLLMNLWQIKAYSAMTLGPSGLAGSTGAGGGGGRVSMKSPVSGL